MTADVIVVGGGLIGLSAARAIAAEGLKVTLIRTSLPGEASPASAGMLAPSVERASGPAHDFAVASRDRYPEYLVRLREETGVSVPLNRDGILQVALSSKGVKGLRKSLLAGAEWLEADELHRIEPKLAHGLGAVFSPNDGSVDSSLLLLALESAIARSGVDIVQDRVTAIHSSAISGQVETDSGKKLSSGYVVFAAGAWSPEVSGPRFGRFVRPARGQMLAYDALPLGHVVYGPRGYLVPRSSGQTLAGSTMEDVGYDSATTQAGLEKIGSSAREICPVLGPLGSARSWAGLRPVTPDLLPLLGICQSEPVIVYACGHSRNGVLLAPLTAEIIADLVVGRRVGFDLTQFRPDRFQY